MKLDKNANTNSEPGYINRNPHYYRYKADALRLPGTSKAKKYEQGWVAVSGTGRYYCNDGQWRDCDNHFH
jgi:hypothetical protein